MYNYPNYSLTEYANQTATLEEAVEKCNKYTQDSDKCEREKKKSFLRSYSCKKWLNHSANELEDLKNDWCGQVTTLRSTGGATAWQEQQEIQAQLAQANLEAALLAAEEAKTDVYEAKASKWFIYVGLGLAVIVAGTLTWYAIKQFRK